MARDKTAQLAEALHAGIVKGDYPAGEAIPSERLLMEEFDVSRTTVRRAIEILIASGLLTRRAGAGTFVAGSAGGQRIDDRQPAVAFIIPTFSDPLYGEMIDGIEREARQHEMRMLAGQSNYDGATESAQLSRYADDPAVRGAIVVPGTIESLLPGARQFMNSGKPLVFLGRWPNGVAADCISSNYRLGARLAVEHLIELGHRQIAYVEGVPHFSGFSPWDGYVDAISKAGMPLLPSLMRIYELQSEAAGHRAISDLLMEGTEFTAVFARSDVTAVGVCRALKNAGLAIPDDVSVASVNNSQIAQLTDPPLTSVDPSSVMLGREAFRLLRERIEGTYDGPIRRIMLDPSLRIRNSSAPPRRVGKKLTSTVE